MNEALNGGGGSDLPTKSGNSLGCGALIFGWLSTPPCFMPNFTPQPTFKQLVSSCDTVRDVYVKLLTMTCYPSDRHKNIKDFESLKYVKVKGSFPYSLPSVGPGADPGVQAVSPQVT